MPPSIVSRAEFQRRLVKVTETLRTQTIASPGDAASKAILGQLEAVAVMTRDGRRPTVEERHALDFGSIASRTLHDREPEMARELYELASFVMYV